MKIINTLTLVLALLTGSLNAGKFDKNKKSTTKAIPVKVVKKRQANTPEIIVVKRTPRHVTSVEFNAMNEVAQIEFLSTLGIENFAVTEADLYDEISRREKFKLLEAYLATLADMVSETASVIDDELIHVDDEGIAEVKTKVLQQLDVLSEQVDAEYAVKLSRITKVAFELVRTSAAFAAGYAVTGVTAPVAVMGAGLSQGLDVGIIAQHYAPFAVPIATTGALVSATVYSYYQSLKASFNEMHEELVDQSYRALNEEKESGDNLVLSDLNRSTVLFKQDKDDCSEPLSRRLFTNTASGSVYTVGSVYGLRQRDGYSCGFYSVFHAYAMLNELAFDAALRTEHFPKFIVWAAKTLPDLFQKLVRKEWLSESDIERLIQALDIGDRAIMCLANRLLLYPSSIELFSKIEALRFNKIRSCFVILWHENHWVCLRITKDCDDNIVIDLCDSFQNQPESIGHSIKTLQGYFALFSIPRFQLKSAPDVLRQAGIKIAARVRKQLKQDPIFFDVLENINLFISELKNPTVAARDPVLADAVEEGIIFSSVEALDRFLMQSIQSSVQYNKTQYNQSGYTEFN